jgi:hypothetical protein
MMCVLKKARIPLFLFRNSNHIFTVWQHLILLVIRQNEGKLSMFSGWLIEEASILQLSLKNLDYIRNLIGFHFKDSLQRSGNR